MRSCKNLAMLLVLVCLVLTATSGLAVLPGKPGISKIPGVQTSKPNLQKITVALPQSGSIWMGGVEQGSEHVLWEYSNTVGEIFNLALQQGNSIVYKFPGDFAGNGSGKAEAWVVIPHSVAGGDNYQLVVTSKNNPDIKGVSAIFSLRNIRLTSPQGGEVWYKGDSHNITWTYSGTFGAKIYIWLLSDDAEAVKKIGEAAITDKRYTWQITADIARRKDYRIYINNNDTYPLGGDWLIASSNKFTIAEYVK